MPGPASAKPGRLAWSLLLALLLLAFGRAQVALSAPTLSIGSAAAAPGSIVNIPVYLSGNTSGVALQFDASFDSARISSVSTSPDVAAGNHLLASGQPTNGVLRVILYSLSNAQFGNGSVLDFQLTVLPGAPEGLVQLQVTNVLMADINASSVQPLILQPGWLNISAGAGSLLKLLGRLTNGQVQLQLTGPPEKRYILQGSSDLSQWTNLSTNVLTGGQITITNLTALSLSERFYRALYAP